MKGLTSEGYKEISHTADWSLEVWALTLERLFELAARGMYQLAGIAAGSSSIEREVVISGMDMETLLVGYLDELLYLVENEALTAVEFDMKLSETHLNCKLACAPVVKIDKQIKAVTFHKLAIKRRRGLYWVTLVFDV